MHSRHADHFRMLIFVPAFMKSTYENSARYCRFNLTKRGTVTTMVSKVKRLLIGRPMKSNELDHEKLSKVKALAVLSSDALSSVAYGTEQILIVLVAAGFTAIWYSLPIALAVLGLLAILILSYRQTIFAYPQGGAPILLPKPISGFIPACLPAALCWWIIFLRWR